MTTIGMFSGEGAFHFFLVNREGMVLRVIAVAGKLPRVRHSTLSWWVCQKEGLKKSHAYARLAE